jgi:hypothetical protein
MSPSMRSRCLISLALVGSLLACSGASDGGGGGGTGGTITASSYDQSCQADTDCVPIFAGTVTCCGGCPNAAINASDESKYENDLTADHPNVCNGACPAIACAPVTAICTAGQCTLKPFSTADGG